MSRKIISETFGTATNLPTGAKFSSCQKYRYFLWRRWSNSPAISFVGLNPSTANANLNDRTLNRCISFAKSWGYGAIYMTNLFALVTPKPKKLVQYEHPIGCQNDLWLKALAKETRVIIAAWGSYGKHLSRSSQVKKYFPKLYALKMNQNGEPAHPLYLKKSLVPHLMQIEI